MLYQSLYCIVTRVREGAQQAGKPACERERGNVKRKKGRGARILPTGLTGTDRPFSSISTHFSLLGHGFFKAKEKKRNREERRFERIRQARNR